MQDTSSAAEPAPTGGATESHLPIGEVAEATGISTHTIRVWERRYGRPRPTRLPSGQRRYSDAQVRWLRRVAEALARGHRTSAVVPAGDRELEALIASPAGPAAEGAEVAGLLDAVARLDGAGLRAGLRQALERHGPRALLDSVLAPLLVAVGRAWADGRLHVHHEHYCSEVLEDFLRGLRRTLDRGHGPRIVLAALQDEGHGLGLQMAAVVCVLQEFRPEILGRNTPTAEIVAAAAETRPAAVAVSVSLATGGVETDRHLAELRRALPEPVRLAIGGDGARGVRRGPRGVEYLDGFAAFETWLARLREQAGAQA
ncbi:MAG: MerR family transcriptional regulator [Planctomycetota bacterium]|nr:MAG: MerR family transcriptional regulator [Planctomycetota bacterium]